MIISSMLKASMHMGHVSSSSSSSSGAGGEAAVVAVIVVAPGAAVVVSPSFAAVVGVPSVVVVGVAVRFAGVAAVAVPAVGAGTGSSDGPSLSKASSTGIAGFNLRCIVNAIPTAFTFVSFSIFLNNTTGKA